MRKRVSIGSFTLLFLSQCGCRRGDPQAAQAETAASVVVAHVSRQNLASTLKVSGSFEPYQEVDLHAKVAGYIRRISVDIGDRVHSGQVIATLEVPELTAQVAGAKAEVRHSESEINRAKSEIARAESSHAALHGAYTRLEQASRQRPGLVAQQELDDASAKDQDAEAQINVAKATLEASRQRLEVSEADTQRVQSMSDYSVVTAPFNGVVTKRYADTGSLIQAGTASNTQAMPVVRVAQCDLLRLRMAVPEADVPYIKEGRPAQIRVQATGRTFDGKITRFSRAMDASTRTMLAEVDVPNSDLSLSPGMFAEVILTLQQHNNVLTIPSGAVIQGDQQGNQPHVLVVSPAGKVETRNVALGIQASDRTEVRDGLSIGENVIVSGQSNYQVGQTVRPMQGGSR
jgi:RND family efflux transporter MFP subunit